MRDPVRQHEAGNPSVLDLLPRRKRRARELHPDALELLALAIQRQLIGVLRRGDAGEQPGAGEALWQRLRRHRGGAKVPFAARAAVLATDMAQHPHLGRNDVELLAHHLAEALKLHSVMRAGIVSPQRLPLFTAHPQMVEPELLALRDTCLRATNRPHHRRHPPWNPGQCTVARQTTLRNNALHKALTFLMAPPLGPGSHPLKFQLVRIFPCRPYARRFRASKLYM